MNKLELLEIYEKIYLVRRCEETICSEYHRDEMKTPVHLSLGAEAIAVSVLRALDKGDQVFGTYRNHALYLTQTDDVDGFFAEMYGRATGIAAGKAGSMHLSSPDKDLVLTSAVVATTIPVAVGAALANQYKDNNAIVAVFFGDGAVEEGAFWESLNFASLKGLKVLFICEDNNLAIHTLAKDRQGYSEILDPVKGFDCLHCHSKGNDAVNVFESVQEQLKKIRMESKPCVMHLPYFRYAQHVGVFDDFESGYRPRPSHLEWEKEDPLNIMKARIDQAGVSENEKRIIEEEIDDRIVLAIERARKAPFSEKTSLFDGVYHS
jgi:TPP-dependent pyruvate/acetoin dehydrogenase alpha subunit